jgi:hypothetical protein
MRRRRELHQADAEELEDHLRTRITELTGAGLRADEAFLIAVKRMGSLDDLSREFAREHSERLWKQLVLPAEPNASAARSRRELPVVVLCAAVAAVAIKVPSWFGLALSADDTGFYARNLSLFALPALAAYFVWRRRAGRRVIGVLTLLFVLGAIAANAYPLAGDSQSVVLTAIHLPLALWLVVGIAYAGGEWRSGRRRMDFIRFSGEWLIYFVLIALGGGALSAITINTFRAIGLDAEGFVQSWLLPCGAMAAVVVSAWLVEAKQSVVENMAPVLTGVFTPLFVAITGRITEWGFSPNKTAALGENLILLANLAWSAWLFLRFVRGRIPFARLENWQTRYMIVYAAWAWTVVLAFPPVFGFA